MLERIKMTIGFLFIKVPAMAAALLIGDGVKPLVKPDLSVISLPNQTVEITIHDRSIDDVRYELIRYRGTSKELLHTFELPDSGSMIKIFDESIPAAGDYRYSLHMINDDSSVGVVEAETEVVESEFYDAWYLDQEIATGGTVGTMEVATALVTLNQNDDYRMLTLDVNGSPYASVSIVISSEDQSMMKIVFKGWLDENGRISRSLSTGDLSNGKYFLSIGVEESTVTSSLEIGEQLNSSH